VFVHRLCSLTGVDWLAAGYKIWTSPTYSMPRDFCCLTADRGFNTPLKKLLTTGQMIAYDRRVFRALRVPLRDAGTGVWAEGPDYLVSPEAATFWSGHSNRHWLPSVAATLGIPKSERDHLGRWGCAREGGSSDYLSTNRQIVLSSQYHVALALCVGARPGDIMKRSYCETELLESLRAHVDKAGHGGRDEAGKHRILLRTEAGWSLVQDFPTFEVAEEPREAETDIVPLAVDPPSSEELWRVSAGSPSTAGSVEGAQKGLSLFWVSISRKTGFRRLHHRHGCGTMEWHCHGVEQIQKLSDQVADAACKQWTAKPSGQRNPRRHRLRPWALQTSRRIRPAAVARAARVSSKKRPYKRHRRPTWSGSSHLRQKIQNGIFCSRFERSELGCSAIAAVFMLNVFTRRGYTAAQGFALLRRLAGDWGGSGTIRARSCLEFT